ncbi:hypothetical protein BDQ12DRAFT_715185 [Crucibulum laeve]|uniref:Uncharacterized protein n=1 Tax=Crucibulum laeve TaxID=68775 RepID=A0A5C3LQU0_9AGAR|nr:hypothetical protein BDQ12DRAFT_715185 [Crucibulum laeve]
MRFSTPICLFLAVCTTAVTAAPAPVSDRRDTLAPLSDITRVAIATTDDFIATPFSNVLTGGQGFSRQRTRPSTNARSLTTPNPPALVGGSEQATSGPTIPSTNRRTDTRSLPAALVDTCSQLHTVFDKITAAVSVDDDIKLDVAIELIDEVKLILGRLVVEAKDLVAHPIESLCELNGKVLSVSDIAKLVASVYALIVACIGTVYYAVGSEVTGVVSLIAEIDGVLSELLTTLFILVSGLLSALLQVPLLQCIISIMYDLKLVACLKVLGYA